MLSHVMRWAWLMVGVLATGCYHYRERKPAPEVAHTSVKRTVRTDMFIGFVSNSEDGPQQNAFNNPLRVGDEVALVVQVPFEMYLYTVNIDPHGELHVLTDPRAPSSGTVRLPNRGFYTLVEPAGPELLALVASPERLDAARVEALVREHDARDDLAKMQSADPPGLVDDRYASMGIRAERLALDDGALRTKWAGEEVVVLFDIDHRAR